jgi:hypothetical protein
MLKTLGLRIGQERKRESLLDSLFKKFPPTGPASLLVELSV